MELVNRCLNGTLILANCHLKTKNNTTLNYVNQVYISNKKDKSNFLRNVPMTHSKWNILLILVMDIKPELMQFNVIFLDLGKVFCCPHRHLNS